MERPLPFRPHPWHGVDPGERFPEVVTADVEMVPSDRVTYEIDEHTGLLMVDRAQRFSVTCETLCGFVPRTYCGEAVAAVPVGSPRVTHGDGDPLGACILTDGVIPRGDLLLQARPIGGLRMVEKGEADDRIVAVLSGDPTYGEFTGIRQLSDTVVERLRHDVLTYKTLPGDAPPQITVDPLYDVGTVPTVLEAAPEGYRRTLPQEAP